MVMVENLPFEATNQILRDVFAQFNPKWCRIVYRNNTSKGTRPPVSLGATLRPINPLACQDLLGSSFKGRTRPSRLVASATGRWFSVAPSPAGESVDGASPLLCRPLRPGLTSRDRMAEPRDRSWFDNPKQAKRRRERMEWERSGAGGRGGEFLMDREWGTRRDGGEFNRPTPQKQYPNYQAGPPPFSSPPSLASPAPGTVFGPGAVGGPPAGLEMMLVPPHDHILSLHLLFSS